MEALAGAGMETPRADDKEEFFEALSDGGAHSPLLKETVLLEITDDELGVFGDGEALPKGYADFGSSSVSLLKTILGAGRVQRGGPGG